MLTFLRRLGSVVGLLVVTLVVSACGGVMAPGPVMNTFVDPTGDEFGTGAGTDWDITTIATTRTGSTLTVNITFTTAPSLPSPGSFGGPTHVTGFLDFDVDQIGATGAAPFTSLYCPAPPAPGTFGMEFYVDLFFRNAAGGYDVFTSSDVDSGDATPAVSGNTLTLTIPLFALGGDNGATNMDMAIGNSAEPTDCAPDGASMGTRPPLRALWRSRAHR